MEAQGGNACGKCVNIPRKMLQPSRKMTNANAAFPQFHYGI